MHRSLINPKLVSKFLDTQGILSPHEPITIYNDTALTTIATSGDGSSNSPYIIENWNITGSISNGIYINGTSKYFIIQNCWIKDSKEANIYITNVKNGTTTIKNNFCINGSIGIFIKYSSSPTVINNKCTDGFWGIRIQDSDSSTVINNTCHDGDWGIYIEDSSFSSIANNSCMNNKGMMGMGIFIARSSNITIINNTCTNNTSEGIYLVSVDYSNIMNNICTQNRENGIFVYSSDSITLFMNKCTQNTQNGIKIEGTDFVSLINNTCNQNEASGIRLESCESITLTNNTSNENGLFGIELLYTLYITNSNNIYLNNRFGGVGGLSGFLISVVCFFLFLFLWFPALITLLSSSLINSALRNINQYLLSEKDKNLLKMPLSPELCIKCASTQNLEIHKSKEYLVDTRICKKCLQYQILRGKRIRLIGISISILTLGALCVSLMIYLQNEISIADFIIIGIFLVGGGVAVGLGMNRYGKIFIKRPTVQFLGYNRGYLFKNQDYGCEFKKLNPNEKVTIIDKESVEIQLTEEGECVYIPEKVDETENTWDDHLEREEEEEEENGGLPIL